MNRRERSQLIDALIDGEISEADFLRLEAEFSLDPTARQEYYDRLALALALEAEAQGATDVGEKVVAMPAAARRWTPAIVSVAAMLIALAAVAALAFQNRRPNPAATAAALEPRASGFAVLASQAGAIWKNAAPLAEGALFPAGPMHLMAGIAQLELFSGVSVVIEGEAEFEVISPMEMKIARGKVRARVPEPAQGFRMHTSEGEVVDLGTEFALEVSKGRSEVHVLDGKVEWHPHAEPMQQIEKGGALSWSGTTGRGAALTANAASFIGLTDLRERLSTARQSRREAWQRFGETLRRDPRLVACYQVSMADGENRRLPNQSAGAASEGAIVAAARVPDRWGAPGGALDFSPAGSRVRVNVPGELRSLTLLTWVKINSLDRWYNSLFLTDGAKLNQPHWQIMDDGRLFFSVKKYEVSGTKPRRKDKHHFMSPPIWNPALSGQWQMLATTYDVDARKVTHFVNGRAVSEEAIPPEYLVEKVSIETASIGNWSEPVYRTDAHFAVRNLNGSMDEFALFAAALKPQEIAALYENGRP